MKKKSLTKFYFFLLLFIIIFVTISIAESKKDKNNKEYFEFVYKDRKEKDDFFKNDKDSPLPDDLKRKFKGLNYFPPDLSFKFQSKLIPYEKKDTINMLTTKSDIRKMIRFGKLEFNYKGKKYQLTAYIPIKNNDYFFVPFADKTNNKQTYSGGRYLDIERKKNTDVYDLDFNFAYNPYCAYNQKYSCPIVPKENHLNISIKAGEKIYKLK
ncbi:MAG: DUF1684 domain-containing protein [Candidatus Kapabacteria bacterium]|nr:DUF1684 domain-containing protein [Candidatus Kapabacteria bacterium]